MINEKSNNYTNIGNNHVVNQTNHWIVDEIFIAHNVNNKLNRSTSCLKFHYENSIALAKDTKRKKDILDEQYIVQSAIYEKYPPMNEDTNNIYLPSIFIKNQYSTLLENIQSNLKNSAITTKLLNQTVVKNIINLNTIDVCTAEIVHLNSANNNIKEQDVLQKAIYSKVLNIVGIGKLTLPNDVTPKAHTLFASIETELYLPTLD